MSKDKGNTEGQIDPNLSQQALAQAVAAGVSYVGEGKADGIKVRDAETGAFKVAREVIIEAARKFGLGLGMQDGQLHTYARDYLDGYAQAWDSPDVRKNRKKEVKAVFEASCIGEKTLALTMRKGDPNRLDENTKKPEDPAHEYYVKETKTGMQWLEGASSYSALYEIARKVKTPESQGGSGGTPSPKKLGDSAVGKMQEALKAATGTQAAGVMATAAEQLFRLPDGERLLVNQIMGISIRLHASRDERMKGFAEKIGTLASDMIARIERSKIESQTSGLVPASAPANLTAPKPAEAVTDPAELTEVGDGQDRAEARTGTEG